MDKEKIRIPTTDYSRIRNLFESRNIGKIQAKDEQGTTEIDLYGEIGFWGVDASMFRSALRNASGDIHLRINSPGGDVFDGIAMYNDLIDHAGKVSVTVSGLAASAASIVAMAGDEIQIHESARFMIHNAWGIVMGNRHDMRAMANVLDGIDDSLARIYANRTNIGIRAIKQQMDEETWIGSKEAVDQGFADGIVETRETAQAKWNLHGFKNTPEDLLSQNPEKVEPWERTFESICIEKLGYSHKQAKEQVALLKAGVHRDGGRESQRDVGEEDANLCREWASFRQDYFAQREIYSCLSNLKR